MLLKSRPADVPILAVADASEGSVGATCSDGSFSARMNNDVHPSRLTWFGRCIVTTSKARTNISPVLDHLATRTRNLRLNSACPKHKDSPALHSVSDLNRFFSRMAEGT